MKTQTAFRLDNDILSKLKDLSKDGRPMTWHVEKALNQYLYPEEKSQTKPEATKEKPSGVKNSKTPPCPQLKIIKLYQEVLPELGGIAVDRWKGSQREAWLQARWREDKKHQCREFWEWYFNSIKTLSGGFYIGKNDRNWKTNLGWLVKRENFDKMIDLIVAERAQA